MPFRAALFVALSLLAAVAGARTRIYTYVDADGLRHYTDTPDNNRYRLLVLSPHAFTESGDHYDAGLIARAARYDAIIEGAAAGAAVEANLLRAVIVVESGFNPRALSRRGAVGLMQVMPATGSRFGVADLYDPGQNVRAGAGYLKFLMAKFGRDLQLVLAAYNAGEDAVIHSGGRIPPFAETQAYVPRVLKIYRTLAEHPSVPRDARPPAALTARLTD